MHYTIVPMSIILATLSSHASNVSDEKFQSGEHLINKCVVYTYDTGEKGLACDKNIEQWHDNSNKFIETYIKENDIKEIISVEANWTEIQD